MGKSQAIFATAQKYPFLARPLVRGACSLSVIMGRRPHWALMRLKEILQIRLNRRMNVDGFVIEVDPLDGPGSRFRRDGLTEPETHALFEEVLKPGMVMIDIGAYIGEFSLVAARAMQGIGRILCLEPTPSVFAQLERNLKRNAWSNVEAIHSAVSDYDGTATFYVRIGSNDQSSLHPLAPGEQISYNVPVTTVDALVARTRLERLDLMKVDVEGHEISVLRGAREMIRRFRPALVIEISRHQRAVGYSGAAIKAFLDELNYDSFRLEAGGRVPYLPAPGEINESISHFNILALPQKSDGSAGA